jgi:phage/plasmid-like protein (TIGR03299 family)
MPAMIENNMMAYIGKKPWHGLGFEVPENATGEEMLVAAGLNWMVQRRAIAMRNGAGDKSIMLTSQLEDYRAIVRSDTDEVFQVASNRYRPVQNREIVDFFREYCEAGHARMETIGGLRNGAVVWALARLNGGSGATLAGGDELRGYMLLASSHDGSLQTIGQPTQTRVVCWNTLSMAIGEGRGKDSTFKMKHVRKFDSSAKAEAQKVMGMACQQVAELNETAADLAKVRIDANGRLEFVERVLAAGGSVLDAVVEDSAPVTVSLLDSVLANHSGNSREAREERLGKVGRAILESIVNSPGSELDSARGTLWGAVNGATYYADHLAPARSGSNRLMSAWFGQGEGLKERAVSVALEMAGKN